MRQKTNCRPKKTVPSAVCRRCPAFFALPFLFCAARSSVLRPVRLSSPPILVPLGAGLSGAAVPARSAPFPRPPSQRLPHPVLRGAAPAFAATRPLRRKRSPKLLPRRPLRGVAADGRGAAFRPGRRCVRRVSGFCRRAAVPDARAVRAGCGPARGPRR